MHDLIIRGGTIADGSGHATRTGDIAIDGSIVTAVGEVEGPARRVIDADGLLVTPGWVDIHTHYDGQATWDPEVSPSGWHGVTTVVMGNCGVGFAPARESDRAWLIQLMEGVEDIPGAALAEGMNWNWETFGEYLDEVERTDRVLDVASLVPHGALRAYVLGEGRANDVANSDEIAEMAALVREAVQAGAIGASTTRTILHRAKDGELAAGTTAAADELIAIGEALGKAGHRVFSLASDMRDLDHEFAWMSEISIRAGVPVTYQVLQADFAPDLWREWIDRGVAANRRGAWLVPQVAGKPTSLMVGFQSVTHPFAHHRAYQEIAHLPLPERVARLRTPEVRAAILSEEPRPGGFVQLLRGNLHKLFPLGDPPDYEPAPERSVTALAAAQGRTTDEVLYDLMLERDGNELLYLPLLDYSAGNLDAVREMLDAPGHGPRARRRRRPLRRAVRRQPPHLHADPLGPRQAAGRGAAGRDGRAPPDPPHGRALRVPRPGPARTGPPGGPEHHRPRRAGSRAPRNGLRPPGVGQASRAARPGVRGDGEVRRGRARARRGDGGAARPAPPRPAAFAGLTDTRRDSGVRARGGTLQNNSVERVRWDVFSSGAGSS